MKLETFFEKFELIAEEPNAVVKLRELIIESAIRGKLVPQAADDEPASELLRRIEKSQAGANRKQAALPPVGDDAYLELPPGWAWTRLGNTGRIFNGGSVSESVKAELAKVKEGLPFIATKDVGYGRDALAYDNGLKVPPSDPRFKIAHRNAVLICAEGGSAGRKIGIAERDICFGNKLFANEVHDEIYFRYIFYVYQAATFFKVFSARMTGIIGGISRREFLLLPIPLPPLAEQKRIVAKVDELMALCDRLEAQQQERDTRHAALVRASLARFTEAPTPANLQFLFHPSYDVTPADLRKAILTLAVQGKLVPQDPNDEPAENGLARIAATKLRLQKAGEIGKEKPVTPLQPDDLPFEAPDSWRWAKLAELTELITKGSSPKWQGIAYVPESEGILFITSENVGNYVLRKLDELKYVAKEFNEIEPRSILKRGDILMNLVGASIGRTAVYDLHDGANINQAVALIRLVRDTDDICPRFLLHYLNSPIAIDYMLSSRVVSAQPNISLTDAREFVVPIPPLAEQRRIVAKVEQLMSLVDELEQQLTACRATAEKLLAALVAELVNAKNAHASVEV
jgi:type I restriction enzyme, S subunit